MTKEPEDWAKIKAYRMEYPDGVTSDDYVLHHWNGFSKACHELARMYDLTEKPPVDPDLMAAREWCVSKAHSKAFEDEFLNGALDDSDAIKGFLAGIEHGRANP